MRRALLLTVFGRNGRSAGRRLPSGQPSSARPSFLHCRMKVVARLKTSWANLLTANHAILHAKGGNVSDTTTSVDGAPNLVPSSRGKRAGGRIAALFANDRAILFLCILVGLIPIWSVAWFPSGDGPIHLYIIHLIDKLTSEDPGNFAQVFQINYVLYPNLTVYGILWILSRLMPMLLAEKLFVSIYWLAFSFSSWYLMRAWGKQGSILGLLLLPFSQGFFLHYGFYNFVLSQAIFLAACGYFVRRMENLAPRHITPLALYMTLLALTHLIGIAIFLMFVGLASTGVALRSYLQDAGGRSGRQILHRYGADAIILALSAIPAVTIVASFYLQRVVTDQSSPPYVYLFTKFLNIIQVHPIFSIDNREVYFLAPFVVLFWILLVRVAVSLLSTLSRLVDSIPMIIPSIVLTMTIVFGSFGFAGFDAHTRLIPFLFFMGVMVFASWTPTVRWRIAISVVVLFATLGTATLHLIFYRQVNALYARFEASRTPPPPGSIIVAINLLERGSSVAGQSVGWRVQMTYHFRETYARKHDLIMLNSELLAPQVYGYFPVNYRPNVTVAAAMGSAHFADYQNPLLTFERNTGLPVSEVSFWPRPEEDPSRWLHNFVGGKIKGWIVPEHEEAFSAELRARWRPITSSGPLAPLVFTKQSGSRTSSSDVVTPSNSEVLGFTRRHSSDTDGRRTLREGDGGGAIASGVQAAAWP